MELIIWKRQKKWRNVRRSLWGSKEDWVEKEKRVFSKNKYSRPIHPREYIPVGTYRWFSDRNYLLRLSIEIQFNGWNVSFIVSLGINNTFHTVNKKTENSMNCTIFVHVWLNSPYYLGKGVILQGYIFKSERQMPFVLDLNGKNPTPWKELTIRRKRWIWDWIN